MDSYCEFCEIISKKDSNNLVLSFKEKIVIFDSIDKCGSKQHILISPVAHIPNTDSLESKDIQLLKNLQLHGELYLKEKWPNEKYR